MTNRYVPNIEQLKAEIEYLENQQSILSARLEANNAEYEEIKKKIEECNEKINEYNNIQTVFDSFKYKVKDVKKTIRKKALKFGIPGLILSWFIGGGIANSVIGAIVGSALVVTTIVGSSLAYYHHKLKDDKEIINNNKINRIKRKIMHEEDEKEKYLEKQRYLQVDNNSINRLYSKNNQELEELRLVQSMVSPSRQNPKKPYSKTYATQ